MEKLKEKLKSHSNPQKAKILKTFFKTKIGEYGEGDIFLGISVPIQRKIVKEIEETFELENIQKLLNSKIHEERFISLLLLISKYEKGNINQKKEIVKFYLNNAKKINNWDLVDISAPKILGDWLLKHNRNILYKLAKSNNLWEKRISIISCFTFIRKKEFKDCIKISKILLTDSHDLIHKAVGWMLREIGKRNKKLLINFLENNYKKMPRTTLRYAIEKFEEKKRKEILKWEK